MTATTPSRKPPRADAQRNEQRLVAAAQKIFESDGIDSSLEEVAKQAGVGIGTLYRHFPTRQHLVEAVLKEQLLSLAARGEELLTAADAYEALKTWLLEAFAQSKHYRGQSECVAIALKKCPSPTAAGADPTDSDLPDPTPCDSMRRAGEALLKRAQAQGAVRTDVTTENVMTMMNAVSWTREQACESQTHIILSVMLDGLRATPS